MAKMVASTTGLMGMASTVRYRVVIYSARVTTPERIDTEEWRLTCWLHGRCCNV